MASPVRTIWKTILEFPDVIFELRGLVFDVPGGHFGAPGGHPGGFFGTMVAFRSPLRPNLDRFWAHLGGLLATILVQNRSKTDVENQLENNIVIYGIRMLSGSPLVGTNCG